MTTLGSFKPVEGSPCQQPRNTCRPCAACEMWNRRTPSGRRLTRNEPLPFSEPTTPSPDGRSIAEPATPRHFLAIDPGPEQSAWVWFEDGHPIGWAKEPNDVVLEMVATELFGSPLVIEEIASYGMPVGREVFQTVRWSGRFEQVATGHVVYLPRLRVKMAHCHSSKANDATIRQAIIDRYGGKERAIGRKATPGPLYGVKADVWAALALGLAWGDANG